MERVREEQRVWESCGSVHESNLTCSLELQFTPKILISHSAFVMPDASSPSATVRLFAGKPK